MTATPDQPRGRMPETPPPAARPRLAHRLVDALAGGLIGLALRLPYRWRVPTMGWIARRLFGRLPPVRRRIGDNLAHVWPDLPAPERRRIAAEVMDTLGRATIELFSGAEFAARAAALPLSGPGTATLETADAAGQPVVLVTAHFGNYDAARAALIARGFRVGGFYRPAGNPLFNRRYVAAISAIGEPLFPAGRDGMTGMLRFLRGGGMLGMVVDHRIDSGPALDFLGKPALTALSAAELALRYDAPLVPIYGIRQPDGLSFRIEVEAPIPHSDPVTMTQALNDSAAARIRSHPGQWFWLHQRWKHAG